VAVPRPAGRSRPSLLLLVAAALTLLTLQFRGAEPLSAFQQGIRDVLDPVRSASEPTGPPITAANTGPGTTPKPAASGDQFHNSWRRSVLNRMMLTNEVVKKTCPDAADQNDRIRKRLRSSNGSACVIERTKTTPMNRTPASADARVAPEP